MHIYSKVQRLVFHYALAVWLVVLTTGFALAQQVEFTVSPASLSEELEKNQTSTQIITLNNNGPNDQTYAVDVQGSGVGISATVTMLPGKPVQLLTGLRMATFVPAVDPQKKIAANAMQGGQVDLRATTAIKGGGLSTDAQTAPMRQDFLSTSLLSGPEQAATLQYGTDFEDFLPGDINGQQGWVGQWGNWTVNSANPLSGSQHLRGLSDGFGESRAFSPDAPIGVEEKSTTSMRINAQGGVTWHIIPQSTSAASVCTRIQFGPTGTMSALVTDGAGGASFETIGPTPAGYFDLTIEVDRDSAYFTVFIEGQDVFTGQGFAGNIEQVVVFSLMEVAGPTLDIDDFSIIDGEKTQGVPFLDVSPASGDIPSGTSVQLIVAFNSNGLEFGTYEANININTGATTLTVPVSLRVFGEPQIDVEPTALTAMVDYKEDTIRYFTIENKGGNPLDYTLQVFGAETEAQNGDPRAWLSVSPASGTVPVNESAIIEATFDAEDIEAGSYIATILVSSNAEIDPVQPVVAQLSVRTPAVMTVVPDELYQELQKEVDQEATQTINIANSGASVLKYALGNTPLPAVAPWLTYDPTAGYIAPGESATITVNFNATELEPGFYSDTLKLSSNDPAHSVAVIPVTLNVLSNTAPEFAPVDTLEVTELDTANVTFTATDIDGEPVSVELMDAPAFVSLISSGDGTATYEVTPGLGDAGEYLITAQATDARGKHDSAYFHLFVIPYGIESFTLINTRTNQEIATFSDTLELDATTSDLHKLTVRANTNPSSVGSVKFEYDNRKKNTDNSSPYLLRNNTLRDIDDGDDHFILARAFTQTKAKGEEGQSLFAVIRMVNAAMVTDFDVVKPNGQNLGDLEDGTTIDISNPSFRLINVKANTQGGVVKSVVFHLNDRLFRIDNLTPYQLGGFGTILDLPLPELPGDYKVLATPYSEHYGRGIAGQSLAVNFTVVDGDREAIATRERGGEIAVDEPVVIAGRSLGIYPVPVRDELNIELVETSESFVSMSIINTQGVQVYKDAGHANRFSNYMVDTNKLGLVRGVYFIHIQYADGRKEVRKFIKE